MLPLVAAVVFAALIVASGGLFEPDDSTPGDLAVGGQKGSSPLITGHVHGIARHPDRGDVYVATHDGLFVITGSAPPRFVGPAIDLMGFTITKSGDLLASGHPGVGTDLPQPVGLIESVDGGKSWAVRSRGGQSDFHALSASAGGVVGYDGTLRASDDGSSWRTLSSPPEVMSLGASPDGVHLLAATGAGLQSLSTAGKAWALVPGAPALVLVDWADDNQVVGADRAGAVFSSGDAGRTWERVPAKALGPPQALSASIQDGRVEILAVTHAAILRSSDGGSAFTPLG